MRVFMFFLSRLCSSFVNILIHTDTELAMNKRCRSYEWFEVFTLKASRRSVPSPTRPRANSHTTISYVSVMRMLYWNVAYYIFY